MTDDADRCPDCGAPLDYDEVDIGVGTLKGNYRCPDCDWAPPEPRDAGLTPPEPEDPLW